MQTNLLLTRMAVDRVEGERSHVKDKDDPMLEDGGDATEELLKGPHPVGVTLEEAGEQFGDQRLDGGAEKAGVGQIATPLDLPIFGRL